MGIGFRCQLIFKNFSTPYHSISKKVFFKTLSIFRIQNLRSLSYQSTIMTLRIKCISFLILIIFTCCGESEEEKIARQELNSIVRQINATYKSVDSSKESEEQLNLLTARSYYLDIQSRFDELYISFSKVAIPEKFEQTGLLVDTLINKSLNLNSIRQKSLIQAINLSNSYSSLLSDFSTYQDYKNKSTRDDFYKKYSSELRLELIHGMTGLIIESADFTLNISDFENNIDEVVNFTNEINSELNRLEFTDSLVIAKLLPDSTDFLIMFSNDAAKSIDKVNSLLESI